MNASRTAPRVSFEADVAIDLGERAEVLRVAGDAQRAHRLDLELGGLAGARSLDQDGPGARLVALREDEEGALLDLQRAVAGEDLLEDRQGARRVHLHEPVEGIELEVVLGQNSRSSRRYRAGDDRSGGRRPGCPRPGRPDRVRSRAARCR